MSGSSACSNSQKTEEAMDHCQNNSYVKAVGTLSVQSNLCVIAVSTNSVTALIAVSTAVRSRVTRTMSDCC